MNEMRQFSSPWPQVLVEMKDFIQLALLSSGSWHKAVVEVGISKALLKQASPQPHFGKFQRELLAIPNCKLQVKISADPRYHQVQIDIRS